MSGFVGLWAFISIPLGLLDLSEEFGYCEGLIAVRAQPANADARHEGAAIVTALYAEFTYPTGGALVNADTAAGLILTPSNHGAARQPLVPSAVRSMLVSHRTVDAAGRLTLPLSLAFPTAGWRV